MIGTFLALDLLLFFVFFEVVLIPMYFVIAIWGGRARRAAAIKFILYTLLGSAVLLLGLLLIWAQTGTLDMVALAPGARRGHVPVGADPRVRGRRARPGGQDPDVAAAHLAARRAHRGADRRLGPAGGRAAQDGHVRLRPDRDPGPAGGRRGGWRPGSGPSPWSASSTARSPASPSATSNG